MLTENDLVSALALLQNQITKIQGKVRVETNPKIINYKIRSFLENVRDICDKIEGQKDIHQFGSLVEPINTT